MNKFKEGHRVIILLDWDGPISNNRTWHMPGGADPVAVNLLNRFTAAGADTVLTSTIRTHFNTRDEATNYLLQAGLQVNWFETSENGDAWRTDPDYIGKRPDEFWRWFAQRSGLPEEDQNRTFIAFDDEKFPSSMKDKFRIVQPIIDCHEGITYRGISLLKDILREHDLY